MERDGTDSQVPSATANICNLTDAARDEEPTDDYQQLLVDSVGTFTSRT